MTQNDEFFFTEPVPDFVAGDPVTHEGMSVSSEPIDPDLVVDTDRVALGI